MDNKRLAIYARKSGNNPNDTSIDSQIEGGKKYASDNGYLFNEYVDEKISGNKGLDTFEVDGSEFSKLHYYERPEFAQMIHDIKSEKIDAVWTFNQDRIERNTNIWIMFSSLIIDKNVTYIVNNSIVDLNDAMTKMMSTIFSVFNEYYSMTTSLRVRPAHRKNAMNGKTHGAIAYGYMRDDETGKYIQDPSEAPIVQQIFNYYDKNSLGSYLIADKLNIEGIECPYAKRKGMFKSKRSVYQQNRLKENTTWSGSTISGILKNTIYKGYKKHGDVKIAIDEPIIKNIQWERVNKTLNANKRLGKRPKHKYLLADILFCEHCRNKMIGKRRNDGTDNAYKCSTKQIDVNICTRSRGLSIPKLENFIIKHLFENSSLKELLLSSPQQNDKIGAVNKELQFRRLELKELQIISKNINDIISSPTLLENKEELIIKMNQNGREIKIKKSDIAQLEHQLDELNETKRRLKIKDTLEGFTDKYDFESMQVAVRSLVDEILLSNVEIGETKNYYIYIKYKGVATTTMFKTDRKAIQFTCVGIDKEQKTKIVVSDEVRSLLSRHEIGRQHLELYDGDISNNFSSIGIELFKVELDEKNLVHFN